MATKNSVLSLRDSKQFAGVNSFFNQDTQQYSNLNLNANQKCSIINPIHSKSGTIDSKSTKNYNASIKSLDQIVDKNEFSNKFDNQSFRSNGLNVLDSQKSDTKKQWKKVDIATSKQNSSTLSLHITAYENSVVESGAENGQNNSVESSKPKMNKSCKNWKKNVKETISTSSSLNVFEIPRQQEEGEETKTSTPEVMQFKASQQLLNPNEISSAENDAMVSGYTASNESLISIIGKLQDLFAITGNYDKDVSLPQIVVVGLQSAGKSSVIEGYVGRDFLPRGTGIVTRRPLLLHVIRTPLDHAERRENPKVGNDDFATFEHKKNEVFTDFEKVREEIARETDRLTGTNKGISKEAIILRIYSADVFDLTLIDLPGITSIPVGDQPPDIEAQIVEMIKGYIGNRNSIILVVHPANQDFTTSPALKLAREVDENGDRTLCVLTKLDLMDRGTDAMDVLTGKSVPVKLGIIGVVNRSQQNINEKKSMSDCLKCEVEFLKKKYPTLSAKNGTLYLRKISNGLLTCHILKCLPDLKIRLADMKSQCEATLRSFGEPIVDKKKTFTNFLDDFADAYISVINGTDGDIKNIELIGGASIVYNFHVMFGEEIQKIHPLSGLTDEIILATIRKSFGPRPGLFTPEPSFDLLIKNQMKLLERSSYDCVDLIYKELLRILDHCGDKNQQKMRRFPRLFERIKEFISSFLDSQILPSKSKIKDILEVQHAYINTKHPDFVDAIHKDNFYDESLYRENNENGETPGNATVVTAPVTATYATVVTASVTATSNAPVSNSLEPFPIFKSVEGRELTAPEKREVIRIKGLIYHYFLVVRKSIQDMVPKVIMNFLVNYLRNNLGNELRYKLQNSENIDELLAESENIVQQRKETSEMLDTLYKGNILLSEIRGIGI